MEQGGLNPFYESNAHRGNFYYRTEFFRDDDGKWEKMRELTDVRCPNSCCGDRKLCMRVNDILGYEVPFNRDYILLFGGRTYRHLFHPETGRLIYHDCENMPKADFL